MALSTVWTWTWCSGAFAAGIIVRALAPVTRHDRRDCAHARLLFPDPLFFVTSGMAISLSAVAAHPFLLVNGRRDPPRAWRAHRSRALPWDHRAGRLVGRATRIDLYGDRRDYRRRYRPGILSGHH